jgi:hypothetical protein
MAGVSPAAITKACRKELRPAAVGDMVDMDHEVTRRYLSRHGVDEQTDAGLTASADSVSADHGDPDAATHGRYVPELDAAGYSEELADLTLKQIVDKYGTVRAYQKILEAHVKKEQALKNRIANAIKLGDLIERGLVSQHIFAFADAVFKRLLSDVPKTSARRSYELCQSGSPVEEAERAIRDNLTSQLSPLKATAERVLRNA